MTTITPHVPIHLDADGKDYICQWVDGAGNVITDPGAVTANLKHTSDGVIESSIRYSAINTNGIALGGSWHYKDTGEVATGKFDANNPWLAPSAGEASFKLC